MEALPIMNTKKQPICYIVADQMVLARRLLHFNISPRSYRATTLSMPMRSPKACPRWTLKPVCYRQARFFCNLWTRKLRTKKLLPLKQLFPGGRIWRRYRNGSKPDGKLSWFISISPVPNFQRSGCNRDLNRAVIMFQRMPLSVAIPEVSKTCFCTPKSATRHCALTINLVM